ncbi:DUF4878 domain-containing protein [Crocinitomicaceae bacterium]|nr:DUF4878 domain-containing protein [Crocinitomicaceae bacterium]
MKLKSLLLGAVAGLLLTACGGEASPEDVTKSFVEALAAGDCDKAKGMAIESALETVHSTELSGCDKYTLEIVSVSCIKAGEDASVEVDDQGNLHVDAVKCSCKENRDEGEIINDYNLKKVDGEWKVASYGKEMPDMNL